MKHKIKWALYDTGSGVRYGHDYINSEDPLKEEDILNVMDQIGHKEDMVIETLPNFYWAHVEATHPSHWRVLNIKTIK